MEQQLQEEAAQAAVAPTAEAMESPASIEQTAAAVDRPAEEDEEEEKATISRQLASKWLKTSVLRKDSRVARHIPETRMYNADNLSAMLRSYGRVVVKPVVGTGGSGVIMIIRSGSGYMVRHRRKSTHYGSFDAMLAAVGRIKHKRSYLIQRGINLATIRGRPIDYRVKVVKGKRGWKTRSMVGRLANPGLFVTNLCRGGTMLSSSEGIRRSLSGSQVRRKKSEMRHITRISIQLMERSFPGINQLGFDYGFDRSGRLWIFEVNTRPH